MIKNRSKIDSYLKQSIEYHFDVAGNVKPMNQELIVLYIDLDTLIEKCRFNQKQRFIVDRIMEGYKELEVAQMFDQSERSIHQTLKSMYKKIKYMNDLDWKYNYMYMNHFRSPWDFKQCIVCGESHPLTDDFYNKDVQNSDGYKNKCKNCG